MSKKNNVQKFIKISKKQRTITNLLKYKGMIYIYLQSSEICRDFYKQAEYEGFKFNKLNPTSVKTTDIVRLYHNRQMNFCGFVGHMAFGSGSGISENICRIDYFKYITGEKDYLYYKNSI